MIINYYKFNFTQKCILKIHFKILSTLYKKFNKASDFNTNNEIIKSLNATYS
jgi:hypothetical protein